MPYTICIGQMKEDSTIVSVMDELHEKITNLKKDGWICLGTPTYFDNCITQLMISKDSTEEDVIMVYIDELLKHEKLGTKILKHLSYVEMPSLDPQVYVNKYSRAYA